MTKSPTIPLVNDHPENVFVLQTRLTGAQLSNSEACLRTIIESSPDAINMLDLTTGRYVFMSPAQVELIGLPAAEIGRLTVEHVIERVHPDDREAFLGHQRDVRAGRECKGPVEYRWEVKPGDYRWLSTRRELVRGNDGEPVAMVSFSRDVSLRKQSEAKLKRGNQLSDALNRVADLVHSSLDIDEVLRRLVNDAAGVLAADTAAFSERVPGGWRVTCVNGMPESLVGTVLDDDKERHAVLALETQQPLAVTDVCTDDRVNRPHLLSYAIRAVLVVPVVHAGHAFGMIFFNYHGLPRTFDEAELAFAHQLGHTAAIALHNARLFADRARVEAALRASEARFRLLATTANKLLLADDPQSVIDELCLEVMRHLGCDVFFNYLAEGGELHLNAFGGLSQDEAARCRRLPMGTAICGRVARDGVRAVVHDVQKSTDPGVALVRGYGVESYCCHPLLGGEGEVLGTLSFGIRRPTTFGDDEIELMRVVADQVATALQRLRARQALSRSNAQMQDVDRKKNDFIATLSHELRNPLAPIKNALYVLDRAPAGGEQDRRARGVIARQAEQMSRLVNDLLDVTRITTKKILLERELVDLDELIARVAEDHRGELEHAGVELVVQTAGGPAWVDADPHRVAQMVGNLLQNAAKFTPQQGRVTASITADQADGHAVIRVSDTGIGMNRETLASLFQPFVQAEASLHRNKGGLGLGLALVKGLAELHGGSVSAESEGEGRGSTFTVRLPLAIAPTLEPAQVTAVYPVAPQRIVIIEDNVDAAESLRDVLELDCHEVVVAHEGTAGIALSREFRPTIVLCDIGLPGMDGYAVARSLRIEPALERVVLVALTGFVHEDDLQRAKDAGFHRHLGKPIDLDQLGQLIREVSESS